jgi:hypothetical protein
MRAGVSDACGREQPIARLQPEALLATGNPAAKLRERALRAQEAPSTSKRSS